MRRDVGAVMRRHGGTEVHSSGALRCAIGMVSYEVVEERRRRADVETGALEFWRRSDVEVESAGRMPQVSRRRNMEVWRYEGMQ